MRIQILQLPSDKVGDVERWPYVVIFDQVVDPGRFTPETLDRIKEASGARGVFVLHDTVEVV